MILYLKSKHNYTFWFLKQNIFKIVENKTFLPYIETRGQLLCLPIIRIIKNQSL